MNSKLSRILAIVGILLLVLAAGACGCTAYLILGLDDSLGNHSAESRGAATPFTIAAIALFVAALVAALVFAWLRFGRAKRPA